VRSTQPALPQPLPASAVCPTQLSSPTLIACKASSFKTTGAVALVSSKRNGLSARASYYNMRSLCRCECAASRRRASWRRRARRWRWRWRRRRRRRHDKRERRINRVSVFHYRMLGKLGSSKDALVGSHFEVSAPPHPTLQADGSASFSQRNLTYSTTTGIFTGTIVTNQCNAFPRTVDGVAISVNPPTVRVPYDSGTFCGIIICILLCHLIVRCRVCARSCRACNRPSLLPHTLAQRRWLSLSSAEPA
jgi:hypothetical protein